MLGCQQVLIHINPGNQAIIEYIWSEANKVFKCAFYYARQVYFKAGCYVSKAELDEDLKTNRHFQAMHSQAAQQTCHSVFESFKSFKALNKLFKQGKLAEKPKLPKYRKAGLNAVNKATRLIINQCLEHNIGTIVFGWNQGQKQESNMGSKNNQKWVQVPTARLKERIAQLCEQYGIRFVEYVSGI